MIVAHPYKNERREEGAALLIVLMVLVTLSSVAILMSNNIRSMSYRARAFEVHSQSAHYLSGAEHVAKLVLTAQKQQNPKIDHLNESWLREPYTLPIEGGFANIRMSDHTACFNVNALVTEQNGVYQANQSVIDEYNHLLTALDIEARERTLLIDSLVDWIDTDRFSRPNGAEDIDYTNLENPYRAANSLIADISELRAIFWYTREIYQKLKPVICAAPDETPMAINLNTIPEDKVAVLYALFGGQVSAERLRSTLSRRPATGYISERQFLDQLQINPDTSRNSDIRERLVLWSRFVVMDARVEYDSSFVRQTSYFEIDEDGIVSVTGRRYGAY